MREAGLCFTIQVKRFIQVGRSPLAYRIIEGDSCVFPSAVPEKFRPMPEAEARLNEGEIHGVNSVLVFFCRIARDLDNWMSDKRASTVFKSIRSQHQIENFGRQIFGKTGLDYFLDAYKQATEAPYGYLLVDLYPTRPAEYRLRRGILPNDKQFLFLPK